MALGLGRCHPQQIPIKQILRGAEGRVGPAKVVSEVSHL